ncbi:cytochrome P450 3A6-like [Ixodes scapularis]
MLIVKDLDLIKKIQIKDFGNFHGRGVVSPISKELYQCKLSLISVDGERWKDMRSLLTPAFTSSNMKKLSNLMDVCSDEFLEVLDSLHDQDKAFEIRAVFQKLTMDVIVRSAFGVQSDVQKNSGTTGMNAMIKGILESLQQFRTGWLPFLVAAESKLSGRKRRTLTNAEILGNAIVFLIAGFTTRTCQHDYEHNGLKIPAGMNVVIPPYHLQHDPALWSEPEKFDPERFSAENKGSFDPMAFQPFGSGPRNCLGMRFAQLEMKLTLAKMLAKYKLLLDKRHVEEDHLKLGSSFALCYPLDGAWLKGKLKDDINDDVWDDLKENFLDDLKNAVQKYF